MRWTLGSTEYYVNFQNIGYRIYGRALHICLDVHTYPIYWLLNLQLILWFQRHILHVSQGLWVAYITLMTIYYPRSVHLYAQLDCNWANSSWIGLNKLGGVYMLLMHFLVVWEILYILIMIFTKSYLPETNQIMRITCTLTTFTMIFFVSTSTFSFKAILKHIMQIHVKNVLLKNM